MSPTIAVVDAEVPFRDELVRELEKTFKAKVEVFDEAGAAIRALSQTLEPDLIIAAQDPAERLKPVTGSDLCRAVHALYGPLAAPPVLVLVAENSPLMPAYQAGATDVLLKPIRPLARLLSKAHMSLGQRAKAEAPLPTPRRLDGPSFKVSCKLRSVTEEGGWMFGSKVILDELGRGGIGVVVKALDIGTGNLSAIKLLQPEHVHDDEWYSRFRREGGVLTGISHPNLVQNNAIGVESGINFIDMDFVVGTPLNELIETRGPLDEEEAFDVVAQIGRGLCALAEAGVVHRDIKPENIMITDSGHAWLIDFGLSKRRGDAQLTQEGEILGTIAFIAPETISGSEPDILADIYALGVTLFEMLTSDDLLGTKSTREIFLDTLRGKTVARAQQGLSDTAAAIIRKMMAVSRKDRYQTPEALLQDLRAHYPEAYKRHIPD